ncbi:hypothetical protein [Dietzia kunjamensis]|uniref:hypothetical protein n=1 Tax=Dietzia kunjamensis TaxID=322509 RepID=UPI003369B0FD
MSLIVTIATTEAAVATLGAVRVSGLGSRPDDVNTYRVDKHQFGATTPVGLIEHRYGDGALAMARKMLEEATR